MSWIITCQVKEIVFLIKEVVRLCLRLSVKMNYNQFWGIMQRGATIVYATHIFDGLETWATHLAYIQEGELRRVEKLSELPELKSFTNLLSVVEAWLRSETKLEKKKPVSTTTSNPRSSPFGSSRHMAYYR